MKKNARLIVNAIPLINVKTGIGRYIEGLYQQGLISSGFDTCFFDGRGLSPGLPAPPDLSKWSRMVNLFWKLPPGLCFLVRLVLQSRRERIFSRLTRDFSIYHETSFFPFKSKAITVFTVHDLSLIRHPSFHPRERVLFFNHFFYERLKQVDFIITVSEFTRMEVCKRLDWPETRIKAVPLAVDPGIFYPRPANERAVTLKRLGVPAKYFLFVGTGDPRKNLELIFKVSAEIEWPVVLVGWEGWQHLDTVKNIHPVGYLNDQELARLYSGALGLIFPSRYEGFGLPVLEAMACGCPVICTRSASIPEVAGDAGLYLESVHDQKGLVHFMKRLAADSKFRKRQGEKGIEQARKFRWERTAEETSRIFRNLLLNS